LSGEEAAPAKRWPRRKRSLKEASACANGVRLLSSTEKSKLSGISKLARRMPAIRDPAGRSSSMLCRSTVVETVMGAWGARSPAIDAQQLLRETRLPFCQRSSCSKTKRDDAGAGNQHAPSTTL
jgi:hypothetical protein